ncbi:hypothetical protein F5141DRAFT_1288239 [Pisolithus sp. B1]|nr:hypothetical protein F5141DRAFT_1288239 [Pisolithus sp. B1]
MLDISPKTIFSIYRKYIREVGRLPHIYLRQFYQIQGSDTFRRLLRTEPEGMRRTKLKRILKVKIRLNYFATDDICTQGLRRLQLANTGDHIAFNRMLDVAYGRVGKLRYELLEPLLSDPRAARPPPIIPGNEKSRPPVHSMELRALLTSTFSRKNPLKDKDLAFPPTLPERAKPGSEEARLLGPLSKRREINMRWRFFTTEVKKVLPPLQISIEPPLSDNGANDDVRQSRRTGFFETDILQQTLDLAGYIGIPLPPTKRQRDPGIAPERASNPFDGKLPVRWLRRRYRELLGRLPILTYRPAKSESCSYLVSIPSNALTGGKLHASRLRFIGNEDLAWIRDVPHDGQY